MPPIQVTVPADSFVIVLTSSDIGMLWIVFAVASLVCFIEWNAILDPKKKKEGK